MNCNKLPSVTAYLIAGVLIGPYFLGKLHIEGVGFVSMESVALLSVIAEVALGFIAFSIGNEFRIEELKQTGKQALVIGIFQALVATLFVDLALYGVHLLIPDKLSLAQVITLGAIATATAPAATLMVVQQYKAKGKLTDILLPVVAIDDAVALVCDTLEMIKDKIGLDIPVALANDADVATLAEVVYGSAKEYNNAVMFTLGTGVGGGVVINNKLYFGNGGKGAELGHATLIMDGLDCTCGRKGCIECYVSATALIRQTKDQMLNDKDSLMWDFVSGDINAVDGRTAFECAKKGDNSAIKVQDNYIKYLGESMLNMFNIFRPDVFILGGGVSAQGKYLIDKLTKYCEDRNYGYKFSPKVKIVTASLGNDAGIIGAANIL